LGLRVLFLQDHLSTGGAARAASRFAAELGKLGVEVAVAAGDASPDRARYAVTGKPRRGWGRVRELFQNAASRKKSREERAERAWEDAIRDFRADLIWIHNLAGAFKWGWSAAMVKKALGSAPVFWTLHDMWALGDGLSYFPEKELRDCGRRSPLAGLQPALSAGRCVLLTPSAWLRDLVRSVHAGPCEAWPNPLDLETFHPRAREKVREELGLKPEDLLLLAAAENLADPRKGIDLLQQAWERIRERSGMRLGLIGRNCPPGLKQDPRVTDFGPVASEKRVAELMAAADLFVHPAQMESYGLVLEEAQACGTPVAALAGSGVGETLEEGVGGWLLPEHPRDDVSRRLGEIVNNPAGLRNLRPAARKGMEKKHRPQEFFRRWNDLLASSRLLSR